MRLAGALLLGAALVGSSAPAPPGNDGYVKADDGLRLFYRSVGDGPEIVIPVRAWTSPHFDALAHGRRLIYYDPRGRGKSEVGNLAHATLAWNLRDLEALRRGLCLAYNRAVGPAFIMHPERADLQSLCGQRNEWPENQDRWLRAFGASLDRLDLRSRIARLTMPRLVVYPERDLIPIDGVREWIEPGGEVRLVVLRNADHTAFLDQPDALMKLLELFLSGHWPDDTRTPVPSPVTSTGDP